MNFSLEKADRLPVEIPNVTRLDLVKLFVERGYKKGVEIGVYKGEFTQVMAAAGLEVYGVDPWLSYDGYDEQTGSFQNKQNAIHQEALERLGGYKNVHLIRKTSMDALNDFADGSLDFVYIDGHHGFRYVAEDVSEWHWKVRKGGIISGHDYFASRKNMRDPYCCYVKEVVDAYTVAAGINPWFVLGERKPQPGHVRDGWRSWFWIV